MLVLLVAVTVGSDFKNWCCHPGWYAERGCCQERPDGSGQWKAMEYGTRNWVDCPCDEYGDGK